MLWMIWLLPIVVTPLCAGALVWWRLRTPQPAPVPEPAQVDVFGTSAALAQELTHG